MGEQSQVFIEKAASFPLPISKWNVAKVHARAKVLDAVEKISWSPSAARKSIGEEPLVLVGPVIGLVTTTSARILLEIDKEALVEIALHKEPEQELSVGRKHHLLRWGSHKFHKPSHEAPIPGASQEIIPTQRKLVPAKRATIFEFKDLTPGTLYFVKVSGCFDAVDHSSFRTFPETPPQTFRLASMSCNSIFITKRTITSISDLWAHLLMTMTKGEPMDLLVHLGDQIYGDGDRNLDAGAGKNRDKWSNRFKIAKDILKDVPKDQWPLRQEEICEKYREVYRDTWKHPPTANCLARCPNLMIYDDHEIRDNWGDNPSDRDRESVDYFIARCAWIANLEYQRQLHEDVDFSNLDSIQKDYHFHVIGNVGLMFLDIRGSRTFHRIEGDKKPYLGSRQWEDIRKALGDDGIFNKSHILLVCTPAPLVFLGPSITNVAASTVERLEDFKGHWSAHIDEQVEMINFLQGWKVSGKGREVLVLGGDVHCGGHSRILKSGEVLYYQLTTSPIANMPLPKSVYYVMRFAEQLGRIRDDYAFTHFNWTRARNYGIVQIKFSRDQDAGKPEIIMQLVRGKFMRPVRMGKKVSNLEDSTLTASKLLVPFAVCKQKVISMALRACEGTFFFRSIPRHDNLNDQDVKGKMVT